MGAVGHRHHRVDQERRQRVLVGVEPQVALGDDLLAGDDDRRRRLALLEVGEREALDAHGAVGAHLLRVDDGDVGRERREEDDLVVLAAERVVDDDDLLARDAVLAAQLGREAALLDDVGPEPRLAGDERDVQRAGEEAQAHHVVGVVLDLHLAALHGLAEADAGRGEAAVAAVGDVEAAHAAGADEHVERLAVGVRHQVQVLDAAAGDLVDDGHRVAVDGEAPDADLVAVVDEALDGLADGHQLAVQPVVLCHRVPLLESRRGPLNANDPSEHGASQLGCRA